VKTLLILDDERILREAFAAYLEDRSWQTILAASGEEALQILETESPAAVLVDVRLTDMSGGEFIRKASMIQPKLAFVIYTGSYEFEIPPDIRQYPQVCNRVFRKPVSNLDDLENEITQTIIQANSSPKSQ